MLSQDNVGVFPGEESIRLERTEEAGVHVCVGENVDHSDMTTHRLQPFRADGFISASRRAVSQLSSFLFYRCGN